MEILIAGVIALLAATTWLIYQLAAALRVRP